MIYPYIIQYRILKSDYLLVYCTVFSVFVPISITYILHMWGGVGGRWGEVRWRGMRGVVGDIYVRLKIVAYCLDTWLSRPSWSPQVTVPSTKQECVRQCERHKHTTVMSVRRGTRFFTSGEYSLVSHCLHCTELWSPNLLCVYYDMLYNVQCSLF